MGQKVLNVASLVVAVLLSSCGLAPQRAPSPVPGYAGTLSSNAEQISANYVVGLWNSNFGAVKIESWPGDQSKVRGAWVYNRDGKEVIGTFSGNLEGNVLQLRWNESGLAGEGYLVFLADLQTFQGRWWTESRAKEGEWNGWRESQAPPAPQQTNPRGPLL